MVVAMVRGTPQHGHGWHGPHGGHGGGPRRGGRGGRGGRGPASRCRWWDGQRWEVRARVERFVEPALLLLLSEGETHGYDLAEALGELVPDERIDLGNLYRLLRALEDEGLVTSRWRDDLPGRAKRTYELTEDGRAVLASWADALDQLTTTIAAFQRRYQEGEP
jgi:PadR family transcriptional regulator PadR